MSAEENKAIVRRYIEELINHGNLAIIDELVAPTYVDHNTPPGIASDREGIKQLSVVLHTAFPDVHDTFEDLIAEGEKVVARWTTRGTHQGPLWGIPPTGKQVAWSAIHIFRIEDGKIVEHWYQTDLLGLLQQLDAIPAPGQAAR